MNILHEIIAYILINSKNKKELYKYRITKLIYLCDWIYAYKEGTQITNIKWFFDNYGPFVWDVYDEIKKDTDLFDVKIIQDFGIDKSLVLIKNNKYNVCLSEKIMKYIDYVLEYTDNLDGEDFMKVVYSTYPIRTTKRYCNLDLVGKAKEFRELLKNKK